MRSSNFARVRDTTQLVTVVLGALGALANVAQAQEQALEEITVTAQKREQSLQDVPMAVSALSGDALAQAGIQNVADLSRRVPALDVQSNSSAISANFRMRRVGALGSIPTFESPVGLFIDGAFRSRAIFGTGELFDIERIEILRGPQSTLYGKNTTAGVLGIYTSAPSEQFTGGAELSAGLLDGGAGSALQTRFKGGVSGPLTESLRGSLSASLADVEDTQGEAVSPGGEDSNDTSRYSVRGQLSLDVAEALSLRLIAGIVRQDDKQSTSDVFIDPAGPLATVILPTFRAAGVSGTCADNDPRNRIACTRAAAGSKLDASEVTLLGSYALSNGWTISSVTSWDSYDFESSQNDVMQVMAPLMTFLDSQDSESLQQELRLSSAGGTKVDWLVGAFLYNNQFDRGDGGNTPTFRADSLGANPVVAAVNQQLFRVPFPLPVAVAGQEGFLDSTLETDYVGVFGQATWKITDAFSLTGGLRWQQEDKQASIRQFANIASPSLITLSLAPAAISTVNDLKRDSSDVTWTVTPQWSIGDDTMLFLTAAHGFKAGGFNTGFGRLPIAQREFADEDVMHYEAGVKLDLLDGRLRLAGSVFSTEYEEYQDAAFVGASFTVGNAEKVELQGLELEGEMLVGEHLTADFSISYADLVYDKNTRGQCYAGRPSNSTTSAGACDLSGEHPLNAPEWKTQLGAEYTQPFMGGDMYARADWSWTDEYFYSTSLDPRLVQDAYSWVNLRAGYRWGNYDLAAWVDNATNEDVVNFAAVLSIYAVDGSYQNWMQAPRSWGLTFRARF